MALFSGGASCCVWAIAYGFEPDTNSYKRSALDTGSGYVARDYDADGALELVGGDRRYRGVFACGACGAQPIRIWQYSSLSFTDETRAFPGRVKDHVRSLLRLYPRVRARGPADLVRGVLTPYVADLCLLGRCRAGLRVVQRARRRGELDRTGRGFEYGPFGVDYVRRLKRFLRRTGYLR